MDITSCWAATASFTLFIESAINLAAVHGISPLIKTEHYSFSHFSGNIVALVFYLTNL